MDDTNDQPKIINEDEKKIEELKIDTTEIKDIEIARTGKWKNGTVDLTETDLDEMIENYNNGVIEPFANLDHDDTFTENVKRALKVVSLGFVSSLHRNGDRLIASLKQVPVKFAELVQSGMLKQRSMEFYKKFNTNGKEHRNVLRAISFFGADLPAVNKLSEDFNVLLKYDDNALTGSGELVKINFKELNMDEMTILKKEYDELISLKKENESLSTSVEKLQSEIVTLKKDSEEKDKELVALKSFKEEMTKNQSEMLKTEADTFISKAIEEGKLLPKYKEMYVNDYIAKAANAENLTLFKDEITSRGKVIDLGQKLDNTAKGEKVNLQNATTDEIQTEIEKLMSKEGISWIEADKKIRGGK